VHIHGGAWCFVLPRVYGGVSVSRLVIFRYGGLILSGLKVSFSISALAMVGGLVIGLLVAMMRVSKRRGFRLAGSAFVQLGRNTPVLVSIMWFTYVLPTLLGMSIVPYWTALMALILQTGGYLAEVFRAGIESISREQRLAARSLGMTHLKEMRRVVLPQAIRVVIPDIMNQYVVVFKTSTLVSVVAVRDLMYQAHRLSSQLFRPTEVYTTVAVIYVLAVLILALLAGLVEKRYKRHLR